jgi:hypothetical protein
MVCGANRCGTKAKHGGITGHNCSSQLQKFTNSHATTPSWYLDDLVLTPVNALTDPSERKAKCLEAQNGLANRIAEYQPRAIVSLLLSIQKNVGAAADKAGSNAKRFAVPFPGMGHQSRFKAEIARIIPELPRL